MVNRPRAHDQSPTTPISMPAQIVLLVLVQQYVSDEWSVAENNQLSSIIIDEIKVNCGLSTF